MVSEIPLGPDNVCTVKETPVAGYDSYGFCDGFFPFPNGGDPNPYCNPNEVDEEDFLGYCQFDNVQAGNGDNIEGDVAVCIAVNVPTPVEVEVTKVWDITNAGAAGDDYSLFAEIIVGCDSNAQIINYDWSNEDWSYKRFYLGDDDYTAGEATVTVEVYPSFKGSECLRLKTTLTARWK